MTPKGWTILFDHDEVHEAIRRIRLSIIKKDEPKKLVLIAILKGGLWTAYQILRHMSNYVEDVRIGHMGISSYGNGRRPDQMKITSTLDLSIEDVKDENVWVIDDIWDTGATMKKAQEIIGLMNPSHLRTATLVHKVNTNSCGEELSGPDVTGFRYIGNGFLAGCGMGCGELYRHYDEIYEVPDEPI